MVVNLLTCIPGLLHLIPRIALFQDLQLLEVGLLMDHVLY